MEEPGKDFFTESKEALQQYVQDRILLLKLQAAEKVSRFTALLFSTLIIALLCFFILLFLSMMAGFYFAMLTGNLYWGFGIVTALYLLILFVLIINRKWFTKKISDAVIRVFFDKNNEPDEKP